KTPSPAMSSMAGVSFLRTSQTRRGMNDAAPLLFRLFLSGHQRAPAGRALDPPSHARAVRAAVQRAAALGDRGVVMGAALILADIVEPGRAVIAGHPYFRVLEITCQRPVARIVTASDAASFVPQGKEWRRVLCPDQI